MPGSEAAIAISPKVRRRQGRTRERILRESARLFAARGFANVSVEDIIDAAEIARSSFYRFFANREELLGDIVRPVFEQGVTRLAAIRDTDALAVMDGIFDTYLALYRANPDALRLSTRIGGELFQRFLDTHNEFRTELTRLLEQAQAAGILRSGSAAYAGRLLARTAVPVLEVFAADKNFDELYRGSMRGLLIDT